MPEFRVRRGHLRLIYCITYNPIQMNNLALKVFDNEQFGSVRTLRLVTKLKTSSIGWLMSQWNKRNLAIKCHIGDMEELF